MKLFNQYAPSVGKPSLKKAALYVCLLFFSNLIVAEQNSEQVAEKISAQNAPVSRIVALAPHAVETLYAMGVGERVIATVEFANYPEQALAIERVGNYKGVQIERIVALQPDLVIVWPTGNQKQDIDKLASLGLPLFYSQPKSMTDVVSEIKSLGQLLGIEQSANQLAQQLGDAHQTIINRYKDLSSPRVFYQMWHQPLRSAGQDSWVNSMINDCNGKNIFADSIAPYPLVSMEAAVIKDPEVIVVAHSSGNLDEKQSIWTNWQEISAIKNQHFYTVNGDLMHRFTPRALKGMAQLCELINKARQLDAGASNKEVSLSSVFWRESE